MIDSHCHPQFPEYDADRDEMIKRTLEGGGGMIAIGTDLETTRQAVALAETYGNPPSPDGFGRAGIWATAGLHPTDANGPAYAEALASLKPTAERRSAGKQAVDNFVEFMSYNKVVAVGEVGLDYYRITNQEERIKQKEVFKSFIELAQKYQKPLILHLRNSPGSNDAFSDALAIWGEMFPGVARPPRFSLKNLGVVHSFTGDLATAQAFIAQGFLIGLNGIITFPPSSRHSGTSEGQVPNQYDELIKALPLGKILIETDAPYLAPVPHRGKRNEPLWVKYVAEKIAQVKNISPEEVGRITTQSTCELFNLQA